MGVELTWKQSGTLIAEPFANLASTTYTFKLKNIGTNAAQEVGFYLKPATIDGDVDNPSSDGILSDWNDILTKGALSGSPLPGFHIIQDGDNRRFTFDHGDKPQDPIPLLVGSGVDSDQLEPDEEVEIQFRYIPVSGDPTRRLYIEIGLVYIEV